MPADYPYPTPFEMLRYLLRSLDFKLAEKDKKHLDDMAGKRVYDPREFNTALEQYFSGVAKKYIGPNSTDQISKRLAVFVADYLKNIAGTIPADGLSREVVLKILIRTGFKNLLTDLATLLHTEFDGPHPNLWFPSDTRSVDALFAWLSDNNPQWDSYLAILNKERRDMIASWRKGEALPSAQSLYLLSQPNMSNDQIQISIDWDLIKPLLFFSRSIDFVRRNKLGHVLISEARLALWGAENKVDISEEISSQQADILNSLGSAQNLIAKLQFGLMRTKEKSNQEEYRNIIIQVRDLINASTELRHTDYWIDWHEARWYVFSGNLKAANYLYRCAFEKAAFVAGENQKYIIEEAIVVAVCQLKPDKVFLKQLKWGQINFGYDIASKTETAPSQKVSDTIEDWELALWKTSFNDVFPKAGYFPGTEYASESNVRGPLFFSDPSKIKPDYRHPNRTIKVGETWQRAMPQLVWFALNENVDVCKKLIDRGADVNVQSEVGDTPILLALESLNVTEVPWRLLNDELFDMISVQSHRSETLNTRTQKKRLLPIISAVETGRPEIVEKILRLGADPTGRGLSDEQTALNVCIKRIGMLKNPEDFWKVQNEMNVTPEVLDAVRRHSSGLSGFTLKHQENFLNHSNNDELFKECNLLIKKLMTERILEKMTIRSMREIATLLISYGADVNAEHLSPIKGYTPLMLAAELNEQKIIDAMLVAGGDINKKYIDPRTGREISLLDIAKHFNSKNVMQSLDDISTYAKFH